MDFGTSIFHNTQHETTLHFLKLELHFLWCKCYVAFIRTFLWFANYITHTASIQHDKARCSWPESKIREMGGGGEWKQWTCLCKTCTYYLVWGGGGRMAFVKRQASQVRENSKRAHKKSAWVSWQLPPENPMLGHGGLLHPQYQAPGGASSYWSCYVFGAGYKHMPDSSRGEG